MASFTAKIAGLQQLGPIIEVDVGVPFILAEKLRSAGIPIPQPVRVVAMIDTGATGSVITPSVVKLLGMSPIDTIKIRTPSCEDFSTYQYHAAFLFPNALTIETTEVVEAPLSGQHIQCLIGRDILRNSVLIYNGYAETITFSV